MDGIKFVGTKTTDLKKCLAFILEKMLKEFSEPDKVQSEK